MGGCNYHVLPQKIAFIIGLSHNFFYRKFQPMAFAPDNIVFYHQTKTLISFWYRRRLNPRFLIQPLEILPVELIRTYDYHLNLDTVCEVVTHQRDRQSVRTYVELVKNICHIKLADPLTKYTLLVIG